MSYAQLSDDMLARLEAAHVSRDARLLYVEATVYCATAQSDGDLRVRLARISDAHNAEALAVELVTGGFFTMLADGFHLPDYLKHNSSKELTALSRDAAREKKVRSRKHLLDHHAMCRRSYCARKRAHEDGDHSECVSSWCEDRDGTVTGPGPDRDATPINPDPTTPRRGKGDVSREGERAPGQSLDAESHPFADDGNGTCVACGTSSSNRRHLAALKKPHRSRVGAR